MIQRSKTKCHKPLKNTKKESFSTQSKIGQKALIQSNFFEQAIKMMGDTIEDMDKETEQKDNKTEFIENKIGLPDCKDIEELNKLGLNRTQSKRKCDRIIDRLKNSLNNHKNLKEKNFKILNKTFALIMTCLENQLFNIHKKFKIKNNKI